MFNHSNSPRISVSGGSLSFSVVHGNQSNSYTQSPQERHHFLPGEEWKEELYREYERTPTGRIRLINTISETGVARRTYEESQSISPMERSDASGAKRVLHLACTVRGTRESPPFLVVKYTGRDARHAFKMDVLRFSQLKDPLFPQLRGFNDSEIPMIIFHDLLIPAMHAIQHAQNSPAILCYLRLQGDTAVSNLSPTTSRAIFSHSEPRIPGSGHIWIRPQTGDVCLGLAGPWPDHGFSIVWGDPTESLQHPHLGLSPLPLSAYNNSALFDYLVQNATSNFVLSALSQQNMLTYPDELMDYRQHIPDVHLHQQPVARFHETTWTFTFYYSSSKPHLLESELAETLMEDGRTRLTTSSYYIRRVRALWFHFRQDQAPYDYGVAWLCQAVHVFHVLGIPREEWAD
ncbi:hypothetical protein PQX77_018102 [Marasmius sp. AFHP31]|nr:hypothetical protein PQX77_018102 [Marasmius sp. AFHP31]